MEVQGPKGREASVALSPCLNDQAVSLEVVVRVVSPDVREKSLGLDVLDSVPFMPRRLIRAGDARRKVTDVRRDYVSGVPENGRRPDRHIVAVPKAWPRLDVGLAKRDELQSWDQKTKQDPR